MNNPFRNWKKTKIKELNWNYQTTKKWVHTRDDNYDNHETKRPETHKHREKENLKN